MTMTATFNHMMQETSATPERFREIVGRLFATGVIFRDESVFEERLYDDARRLVDILEDYFSISGFRLMHDPESNFMRLYPPGAWVPGLGEADAEGEKLLKTRLSADFVALCLVFRFLYQQGLAEGRVEVSDEVHVRMEDVALAMSAHLSRTLPEGKTDRLNLFREMKRQRVVRFNEETDFNNGDGFIAIRRPILSLVGEDALQVALDLVESRKPLQVEESKPAEAAEPADVAASVAAGIVFTGDRDGTVPSAVLDAHLRTVGRSGSGSVKTTEPETAEEAAAS